MLVCFFGVATGCQVNIYVSVAFTVFFTLVNAGDLVAVLSILVVIVMASVMRVTFLIKVVED